MMRTRYDVEMRTTIDLPDDLHRLTRAIARDEGQSLSETVTSLLRRALGQGKELTAGRDPSTGLPTIRLGGVLTSEDVRSLDDES